MQHAKPSPRTFQLRYRVGGVLVVDYPFPRALTPFLRHNTRCRSRVTVRVQSPPVLSFGITLHTYIRLVLGQVRTRFAQHTLAIQPIWTAFCAISKHRGHIT